MNPITLYPQSNFVPAIPHKKPRVRKYNRYLDVEINVGQLLSHTPGELTDAIFLEIIRKEKRKWLENLQNMECGIENNPQRTIIRENAVMWIKLDITYTKFLAALLEDGFVIHHAKRDYIMLILSSHVGGDCENIPLYSTHYIRVECIVLNDNDELLLVQEIYQTDGDHSWKFVTGGVGPGEYLSNAACREVVEETGIYCTFCGILGIGNRVQTRFDMDEILVCCVLRASPQNLLFVQKNELKACKWVPLSKAETCCSSLGREWLLLFKEYFNTTNGFSINKTSVVLDSRKEPHLMHLYHPGTQTFTFRT